MSFQAVAANIRLDLCFVNHIRAYCSALQLARNWATMRVLLIEDDRATAQSIELMLETESFTIYTTSLGEEGLDLGKLYDYDIILLDLKSARYIRL